MKAQDYSKIEKIAPYLPDGMKILVLGPGGTIDNAPAQGICGTGLIDLIAELLRSETVDESGYIDDDYVICDGVSLACSDVRQYQLAKSAVCSAIITLMKR